MLTSEQYPLPAGLVLDVTDALHPHCEAALADWLAASRLDLADLVDEAAPRLPEGLGPVERAEPGPAEPAESAWSVADLSDHDLLETLAAQEAAIAALHSAQVEMLAEFGRRRSAAAVHGSADDASADDTDDVSVVPHSRRDFAADEVMARMRWTAWTARHRLGEAERLSACLPATWEALADGRIDYPRVRRIVNATWELEEADAAAVDAVVADAAEGLTTAQLDELLAAEIAAVDAAASARRAARAAARRRVGVTPLPDGMARLVAEGPAPDVLTMFRGITAAAQAQQRQARAEARAEGRAPDGGQEQPEAGPGVGVGVDVRVDRLGIDAWRFDVLTGWARELLDGRSDAGGTRPTGSTAWRPHVLVTVPLTTLMGLDDDPGHLHGYGPLPAAMARQVAADGTLRRLLTDAAGVVVGVDGHTHPGGLNLPGPPPNPDDEPPGPPDEPPGPPDEPPRPPDEPPGPPDEPPGPTAPPGPPGTPPGPPPGDGTGSDKGSATDTSADGDGDGALTPACPLTGTATSYRPSAALTRLVRYRDVTCTAIGCRRPADTCDLDHLIEHPAGPTCACNLHPLCRRHHRMKHRTSTEVRRLADGSTLWTMPTGHAYVRPPRPAVHRPVVRRRARRDGAGGSMPTTIGPPAAGAAVSSRPLPDSTRYELRALLLATGELPPEVPPGYEGPPPF